MVSYDSTEQTVKMSTLSINETSFYEPSEFNPFWNKLVICCLCAVGLCGNIIVCYTIWKATFLHNATNYLIVNLAATDCFVCIFSVCRVLTYTEQTPISSTIARQLFCRLIFSEMLWWMSVGASTTALVLVSFERYIGIVHPLRYEQFITKRKFVVGIVLQWTLGPLTNFYAPGWVVYDESVKRCKFVNVPLLILNICYASQHITFYLVPVVTLIYLYVKMFNSLSKPLLAESNVSSNGQRASEIHRARKNIVVNLLMITILFIICITPGQVVYFTYVTSPEVADEIHYKPVTQITLYILPLCNSVLNPIIYSFRYKKFQKALRLYTCKYLMTKTHNIINPTVHSTSR